MAQRSIDQRRLAFGQVAELYERARPTYPQSSFDDLIRLAGLEPGARVLEVGAGTGKATRMLAERSLSVIALEPDAGMAEVARRSCAGSPQVRIEEVEFERWRDSQPVVAVISAQAWHWIAVDVRYERASAALAPNGTLAALWTLPSWGRTALRAQLGDAYRVAAPDLAPDFPMHPASDPEDLAGDWCAEIGAAEQFSQPQVHRYPWTLRYTTSEYLQLLQTHQDHILLEAPQRTHLLEAVASVIDRAGATICMEYVTRLCLARRT